MKKTNMIDLAEYEVRELLKDGMSLGLAIKLRASSLTKEEAKELLNRLEK